jgi:gliding motility-associated lipoprotein GldB
MPELKMKPRYNILILICFFFFSGCRKKSQCIPSPDISTIKIDFKLERLDLELMKASSPAELHSILASHEVFSELFLYKTDYPDDSTFTRKIYGLLKDPHIDTLHQEVKRVFGDAREISNEFEEGFRRIKYYYPEYKVPKIETVISGLSKDMWVSDSLIIIGLDFYLGNGAKYRPLDIPEYLLNRYQKHNLVPNTFLFISGQFSRTDRKDNTLLADMIFYGKAFQFAKQMLPCVPDSVFLGYSPREMKDIFASQEIIWANFIENNALYTTDQLMIDRFISERPKTFEIGENCPGRIGRWIGWEIVKDFIVKNPDVSFPGLMKISNAQDLFTKSRFKPHNQKY